MKTLIVYDSLYGNTEKIAGSIASAIKPDSEVEIVQASKATPSLLKSIDLLIVGSPTHGGRPSIAVKEFMDTIPEDGLKGISVAAFDTRTGVEGKGLGIRMLVKVLGYATGRIRHKLVRKGGTLVGSPEGFCVRGREGPLEDGELERAATWAKEVIESRK